MVGAYGGWVSWWVAKQSKQMHCLAMDGHSQTILGANKKDYIVSLSQVRGGNFDRQPARGSVEDGLLQFALTQFRPFYLLIKSGNFGRFIGQ